MADRKHALLWLHALTPLHNGAGEGLGSIDRPIIREATTGYPFIQSSTLKGAMRPRAIDVLAPEIKGSEGNVGRPARTPEDVDKQDSILRAAFGKGETDGNQGCLIFTDAQLLLLPVRSLVGTFVWVTSQLPLARLLRWLEIGGDHVTTWTAGNQTVSASGRTALIDLLNEVCPGGRGAAVGCKDKDSVIRVDRTGPYCIEGLVLNTNSGFDPAATQLAKVATWLGRALFPREEDQFWRDQLGERLLLLHDDDFTHLVHHAMQVEANIRIGKTGVTKTGSLRYTEYLPTETVMVSLTTILPPLAAGAGAPVSMADVETLLDDSVPAGAALQFGADESKGRGIVRGIVTKAGTP